MPKRPTPLYSAQCIFIQPLRNIFRPSCPNLNRSRSDFVPFLCTFPDLLGRATLAWDGSAGSCIYWMAMGETIQFVVRHGYLVIFFWLLAEQAAVPIPSLPLLLVSGALVRTGQLKLSSVLGYAFVACAIADTVWFHLGKRYSGQALQFICKMSIEPDSCVRRTENLFVRYGLRSLLLSKFIPGFNVVAAPLAGGSGAGVGRFLLFDSLGVLIWISTYVFAGYLLSDQVEIAAGYAVKNIGADP